MPPPAGRPRGCTANRSYRHAGEVVLLSRLWTALLSLAAVFAMQAIDLARSVRETQMQEIEEMQQLLTELGN